MIIVLLFIPAIMLLAVFYIRRDPQGRWVMRYDYGSKTMPLSAYLLLMLIIVILYLLLILAGRVMNGKWPTFS